MAMLWGMGWKPGEGIGRTFNHVVKPRVSSLRPKGLGLGARSPHCPSRPEEEQGKDQEDHPQGLGPGDAVLVLCGLH